MADLFFDTSALIRRYDRSEPGSAMVLALCNPNAGNRILISRITTIEVSAALNRKLRMGAMDQGKVHSAWAMFNFHRDHEYTVSGIDEVIFQDGEQLPFQFNLRAYDSLQIAAARRVQAVLGALASNFQFCTSDRAQAAVAEFLGLSVRLIS